MIKLGHLQFMYWLTASQHQAITWIKDNFSINTQNLPSFQIPPNTKDNHSQCSVMGMWSLPCNQLGPGSHPMKDLQAHNQNLTKNIYLLYTKQWPNQVIIWHMSRQLCCRGMCQIVTWFNHENHNEDFSQDFNYELINGLSDDSLSM